MKQIQLPDSSYIHPAKIEKFGIGKHFLSSNYYVYAQLRGGRAVDVAERLSLSKAEYIRTHYDEELKKLHLETSPLEDVREIAREEGRAEGRAQGIEEGKARAEQLNWSQAERNGIESVLSEINSRIEDLYQELKYEITGGRRKCVESTISLLSGIVERFALPPPDEDS